MEKQKIRIIDNQFNHAPNSFGVGDLKGIFPKYFEWYRGSENMNDVVVITENCIHEANNCTEKIKILLIIESPLMNPPFYNDIRNPDLYNKFDYILTFSKDLVAVNPNKFIWYAFCGCWIFPFDWSVHQKTKDVSIVASNKRITEGHRLRHDAIEKFRDKIEGIYGNGYQFVENKIEALKDFRFHIVIENDNCADMFSEKIIDAFVTGSIPIYWGSGGNIGNYFNERGILRFNNLPQLETCLFEATENFYNKRIEAVKENFDIAMKYTLPENEMWKTFFEPVIFNK